MNLTLGVLLALLTLFGNKLYAQSDSCINNEYQERKYSNELIEIFISVDNARICPGDTVSIDISIKNLSGHDIYYFENYSVLHDDVNNILSIDQGYTYGNGGLISMEVEMKKLAPYENFKIHKKFDYDSLKKNFNGYFEMFYGLSFLPDVIAYSEYLKGITYDEFPLEIREDKIIVSSYPLEIFLENHGVKLSLVLM